MIAVYIRKRDLPQMRAELKYAIELGGKIYKDNVGRTYAVSETLSRWPTHSAVSIVFLKSIPLSWNEVDMDTLFKRSQAAGPIRAGAGGGRIWKTPQC